MTSAEPLWPPWRTRLGGQSWPVTQVTADFTDEGGKTRFAATVRYPSLEVRNMVLASGMARGAGISDDRLEDLVAELQRS